MKIKKLLLVIFLTLSLAGFNLFAKQSPDWVSGFSGKYPEQTYLLGIGLGDTLDEARSAARAEISKVFKAKVMQSSKDTKQETSIQQNNKNQTSGSMKTELETSVFTEEVLEGVEITETWLDEKNKTYYALAVLNKTKTRALLAGQVAEQEEIIQSQFELAKKMTTALEEIKALNAVIHAFEKKETLLAKKRIVDPVAIPEIPSSPSLTEVKKQKEEALKKIVFVVEVIKDEANSNLKDVIGEVITKMGFKVSPLIPANLAEDSLLLIVKYQLTLTPFDRGNPQWKFYRWQGTIEISEGKAEGKVLTSVSKQGEESHISDETAKIKAIGLAKQSMALAVQLQINKYIFGK